MHKKLTASAVTGFLLAGAAGVAMAQQPPPDDELPPLVVFSVQITSNIVVDPPIVAGDLCADAVSAIRAARLKQQEVTVLDQSFLAFVFTKLGAGLGAATLVCAAEGTAVPTPVDGG